jgi:hypothetical protein
VQFLVGHFTFLGFDGQNWMLIVVAVIAAFIVLVWKTRGRAWEHVHAFVGENDGVALNGRPDRAEVLSSLVEPRCVAQAWQRHPRSAYLVETSRRVRPRR